MVIRKRNTPTMPSLNLYHQGLQNGLQDGQNPLFIKEDLEGKRAEYQLGYKNGFELGRLIIENKEK